MLRGHFDGVILVLRERGTIALGVARVSGVEGHQWHALLAGLVELLVDLRNLAGEDFSVRPQLEPDESLLLESLDLIHAPPDPVRRNREGPGDEEDPVVQLFLRINHVIARNLPHAVRTGIFPLVVLHPEQTRERDADGAAPFIHRLHALVILDLGIHVGVHVDDRHRGNRVNHLLVSPDGGHGC